MNAMQRGDERQPQSDKRHDACVNLSHGREIGRAFAESLNSHSSLYPNYNRSGRRGKDDVSLHTILHLFFRDKLHGRHLDLSRRGLPAFSVSQRYSLWNHERPSCFRSRLTMGL